MTSTEPSNPVHALVECVAALPAWVGTASALLAAGGCRAITEYAPKFMGKPGDLGELAGQLLVMDAVRILQYLLPALMLIGVFESATRGLRRGSLISTVVASSRVASLEEMTWSEFELLVGEAYRRRGYAVTEMGGPQADGGIDLILTRRGQRVFVQCKQWKALAVGVDVVRQLKGVIATHQVAKGIVVTSGRFTREARAFGVASGIDLVDGRALHAMIRAG